MLGSQRVPLALAVLLVAAAGHATVVEHTKLRKPRRGFQMQMHSFTVHAGEDLEVCQYRRLPNKHEMDAQGFELRMPKGAHHFVVWGYNGNVTDDSKFPKGPVETVACTGLGPGDSLMPVNLFGQAIPNARVRFPAGVAVRLKPRQQVWLNPHMKNAGSEDFVPDIKFNITPAPKGSVQHHAEFFTVGNIPGINVPAGGDQTLVSEWTVVDDMNVIMVDSHQHRLGTYVSIETEQPDGSFVQLYENTNWEHPYELWPHQEEPWKNQGGTIRFTKGQKIRFTCKWHNSTTDDVHFGVETTDEMCFMTGYYYRDDESAPRPRYRGCGDQKEGFTCFAPTLSSSVP
jgi:hypothetical protein